LTLAPAEFICGITYRHFAFRHRARNKVRFLQAHTDRPAII